MLDNGVYVRSLVQRNNILAGYIGVLCSNKEPYIVLFSIDGKECYERYLCDEIEMVTEYELSFDELNDFLDLKSDLSNSEDSPHILQAKDKPAVINLNHIKNVLELVDDNSISIDKLACWFYTIYYSKSAFRLDSETEGLIKEFFDDIDTFLSTDTYQYFSEISSPILKRIYNLNFDVNEKLKNIVLTKKELRNALYKIIFEGYNADEREDLDILIEKLVESDPSVAYFLRGYLYFYGLYGFKNDIEEATKWFSKSYEIKSDSEAEAFLGEIALINMEYDNAFKYLSHSALLGYYKGKYLLSDMYLNGYGIIKTPEIAATLLINSIDELKRDFVYDGYSRYFGEFSERIGKLFYYGNHYKNDYDAALIAFLEARLAYKRRYLLSEYPFDKENISRVNSYIKKINDKRNYNKDKLTNVSITYDTYMDKVIAGTEKFKVTVKKEGNFIHMKIKGKRYVVTEPISNYCEITDTVKLTFEFASMQKAKKSFTADMYDSLSFGTLNFYRKGKLVNTIKFEEVYFNGEK